MDRWMCLSERWIWIYLCVCLALYVNIYWLGNKAWKKSSKKFDSLLSYSCWLDFSSTGQILPFFSNPDRVGVWYNSIIQLLKFYAIAKQLGCALTGDIFSYKTTIWQNEFYILIFHIFLFHSFENRNWIFHCNRASQHIENTISKSTGLDEIQPRTNAWTRPGVTALRSNRSSNR